MDYTEKKQIYKKESKKSEQKIDGEDYEVLIPILNLDVKDSEFRIGDITVKKMGEKSLEEFGIKKEFKNILVKNLYENIVDKTAVIIPIRGNNITIICENARKKADDAIRVLQVALSSQWGLTDLALLFKQNETIIYRKKNTPSSVVGNWHLGHRPLGLEIDEGYEKRINEFLSKIQVIFDEQSSSPKLKFFKRALTWIGRSIDEEDLDIKIIKLSIALETILTKKHDKMKGEALTARMLFLNDIISYLFNWNEIPGNDNARLIKFLRGKFGIYWVKTNDIKKIDDYKTIRITNEKNSLTLKLNNEETKVNLEIDDGRIEELTAKKENGQLNIYYVEPFTNPAEVLRIYVLRSEIVHGSKLGIASKDDYLTMLQVAIDTLIYSIQVIQSEDLKTQNKFIETLNFHKGREKIIKWLKEQGDKNLSDLIKYMEEPYLFSWDNVPGKDNERLLEYLKQKYGVDLLRTAKIEKIDNNEIIVATENHLSLRLNNENTMVTLTINNVRTDEFIVKTENNKLNIIRRIVP